MTEELEQHTLAVQFCVAAMTDKGVGLPVEMASASAKIIQH